MAKRKQPEPDPEPKKEPRTNAIETDPRFPVFADLYVERGNAYKAALQAGYPEDYARAHSHQLVARLRLKIGRVLRSVGLDELAIAKKLKKLSRAKEPKWNQATKKWDRFENATVQLGALQTVVKLLGIEPAVVMKLKGEGEGGAVPFIVKHSIPQPGRKEPKVEPPA